MSQVVEQMLDRQEIVDLTIAYGWILDHGPREELRTVFTEDAVAVYGGERFEGVDSIIAKVEQSLGHLSVSQHLVSNQQVEIDGDTGRCRCYLQAQHTKYGTEGGENFIMAGRYEDVVVRTGQGWRISKRELTIDWTEGNREVTRR